MSISSNPLISLARHDQVIYYFDDGAAIFGCIGNPEGVITAGVRSLAINETGSVFVKTTASGSTGWLPVALTKTSGQIIGVPKSIHTNSNFVVNSGAVLTDLHSFTLPANSLANNGDYLDVTYSGNFTANANTKRIVILFGGVTVHDSGPFDQRSGNWTYIVKYLRVSATLITFALLACWGAITASSTPTLGGNGLSFAFNSSITVSDLGANSQVLKVQAQGGATSDIDQSLSILELTQNA